METTTKKSKTTTKEPRPRWKMLAIIILAASIPVAQFAYSIPPVYSLHADAYITVGNSHTFTLSYTRSMAVGEFNSMGSFNNAMAVGDMLTLGSSDSVVIGRYNELSYSALFVVGDGTSEPGHNAFEVHDNGDVIIPKQQGDISMGIFTAP